MAKLNDADITKDDVEEYIKDCSDFAFELKVLKKFNDMNFKCLHSGVYEDPVTKKSREFDIRAEKSLENKNLKLAIECKNFRANFPLVSHCVKRVPQESFHDLIIPNNQEKFALSNFRSSSLRVRLQNSESLYPENGIVAKSIDQVGRGAVGIISNDGSVFEKINQALHSAYDLIEQSHYNNSDSVENSSLILPILVIPDSRLWVVEYNEHGLQLGVPKLANSISYFVGQSWRVGHVGERHINSVWYNMSHLEIVSFSHLESFLNSYFNPENHWEKAFTNKKISELHEDNHY
jgi:hypothetical protein